MGLRGLTCEALFCSKWKQVIHENGDLGFTAVLMFVMAVASVVSFSLILASLGGSISLEPMSVIGTLLTLQLIPLGAGMLVNGWREPLAAKLVPIFSTISRVSHPPLVIIGVHLH